MAGSDLPCLARPHQSFVSVPNTEPGSVPGYWSSAPSGQFLRSSGTGSGVVLSTAAGLTFHIQHQHCTDRGAGSASLFEVLELHFPPIFPQNLHRCIDQFRTNLALNLPTQRGSDLSPWSNLSAGQAEGRRGLCLWDQLLLVCCLPLQSPFSKRSSGTAAPQVLGISGLASQEQQHFLCRQHALLLENVSGFVLIKAEESFATVFQARCCLWGERNLKNSLIYHVKKRWHIYCYINVIYIVFSVTLTEIFWTSCCWLERFISNTLKFDTGYKSAINQQWKLENKMRSNSSRTISSYNTP